MYSDLKIFDNFLFSYLQKGKVGSENSMGLFTCSVIQIGKILGLEPLEPSQNGPAQYKKKKCALNIYFQYYK